MAHSDVTWSEMKSRPSLLNVLMSICSSENELHTFWLEPSSCVISRKGGVGARVYTFFTASSSPSSKMSLYRMKSGAYSDCKHACSGSGRGRGG